MSEDERDLDRKAVDDLAAAIERLRTMLRASVASVAEHQKAFAWMARVLREDNIMTDLARVNTPHWKRQGQATMR